MGTAVPAVFSTHSSVHLATISLFDMPSEARPLVAVTSLIDGCFFFVTSDIKLIMAVQQMFGNRVCHPMHLQFFLGVNCESGHYGVRNLTISNPEKVEAFKRQHRFIGSNQLDHHHAAVVHNREHQRFDIFATSAICLDKIRNRFDLMMKGRRSSVLTAEEANQRQPVMEQTDLVSQINGSLFVQMPRGHIVLSMDDMFETSVKPYLLDNRVSFVEDNNRMFVIIRPFSRNVDVGRFGVRDADTASDRIRSKLAVETRFKYIMLCVEDSYMIRLYGVHEQVLEAAVDVAVSVCSELGKTRSGYHHMGSPHKRNRTYDHSDELHFLAY